MERPSDIKSQYLHEVIETKLAEFKEARRINKGRASRLRMASAVSTAAITVLLGWRGVPGLEPWFANTALLLAAISTVASAYEAFFDHRGLWIIFTDTEIQLAALRAELGYVLARGQPDESTIDRIFERYNAIVLETQASWRNMRQAQITASAKDKLP